MCLQHFKFFKKGDQTEVNGGFRGLNATEALVGCCCQSALHSNTFLSAGIPGMPANMFFQLRTKPPRALTEILGAQTTAGEGLGNWEWAQQS